MNGHHTGMLIVSADSGSGREMLWSMVGDQKPGWHLAAVDIDGMNHLREVSLNYCLFIYPYPLHGRT